MIRPFLTPLVLHFWASRQNSMAALSNWGHVRAERNAFTIKVVDSEFLRDDLTETMSSASPRTLPEFPTDVPVPEPHDVPVPEPIDVPPPSPGEAPSPAKPPSQPATDPKPRTVP